MAAGISWYHRLFGSLGKEIGDPLMDGIIHMTGSAVQVAFKDLFFIFCIYPEHEVAFADRAAEDVHERTFHAYSFLISIIWVSSGPVEMSVTGQPMSSSAVFKKSFAFLVSLLYSVSPKQALSI